METLSELLVHDHINSVLNKKKLDVLFDASKSEKFIVIMKAFARQSV